MASGTGRTCIWPLARNAEPRQRRSAPSSGGWGNSGKRSWTRDWSSACSRLPSLVSLFRSGGARFPDRRGRAPRCSCTPTPASRAARRAERRHPRTGRRKVAARRKAGPAKAGRAPRGSGRPTGRSGRRRAHYVVAGVVSFLVGVGGLSFVVGGGSGAPGPRINPPVEMFTVEHSVTTGEIPFANPTATFLPTPTDPRRGP